jgi:hypothetical protein
MTRRVVAAQVLRNDNWLLKSNVAITQTPQAVGSALKNLAPTFVHGLVYKDPGVLFTDQGKKSMLYNSEMAQFIYIRNATLQSSPYCKFNLVLDATKYIQGSLVSFNELMADIKNRTQYYPDFMFDAIHFEHWNQAYQNDSTLANYVIQYLHQQNMIVGGNTYGGSIPEGTDYGIFFCLLETVGVTTDKFQVNEKYADNVPGYILITNSNPMDLSSEACAWINSTYFVQASSFSRFSPSDRINTITTLAATAKKFGYSFAWPIFAPSCPSGRAYDSLLDYNVGGSTTYSWILLTGMKSLPINKDPYTLQKAPVISSDPFVRNVTANDNNAAGEPNSLFGFLYLILVLPLILGF